MSASQVRLTAFILAAALSTTLSAQTKPRARDLGVPFDGTPGPNNAITDVKGVEVGHTTLISGEGKLEIGRGPVRTGVTAIHPRGKASNDAVFAAVVENTIPEPASLAIVGAGLTGLWLRRGKRI